MENKDAPGVIYLYDFWVKRGFWDGKVSDVEWMEKRIPYERQDVALARTARVASRRDEKIVQLENDVFFLETLLKIADAGDLLVAYRQGFFGVNDGK